MQLRSNFAHIKAKQPKPDPKSFRTAFCTAPDGRLTDPGGRGTTVLHQSRTYRPLMSHSGHRGSRTSFREEAR
ncbi:unnamed protein product [Boreogadus saida]